MKNKLLKNSIQFHQLLVILTLCCCSIPLFAVDTAVFQLNWPEKFEFTDQCTITMQAQAFGQAENVNISMTAKAVVSKSEGGFLEAVVLDALQSNVLTGKDSLVNAKDLKALSFSLTLNDKGEVTGYDGDNTPEAWLQKKLPPETFTKLKADENFWKILNSACQENSVDQLILLNHPAEVGAHWSFVDTNSVATGDSVLPFIGYSKVIGTAKVSGKQCLTVETLLNSDEKALAQIAGCDISDLPASDTIPAIKLPEALKGSEAKSAGKDTFVVDPLTLRCYKKVGTRDISLTINMENLPTEDGDKQPATGKQEIKMNVKREHTYSYK